MALDVGKRIIGVAIASMETGLVFPRDAIDQKSNGIGQVLKIIKEEGIGKLIVGLPLNSDGSENEQCDYTKKFIKSLKLESIEVHYINEYGTSKEAEHRFKSMAFDKTIKRGTIDSTSASIILETFLKRVI